MRPACFAGAAWGCGRAPLAHSGQFVLIALALLAAMATRPPCLMLASVLLGIGATAAQQIFRWRRPWPDPARRGAVVGSVMSGLLGGILLSRTGRPCHRLWKLAGHVLVQVPFPGPAGRAADGQDDTAGIARSP